TPSTLIGRQARQRVVRTSKLEGTDGLEQFRLQPDTGMTLRVPLDGSAERQQRRPDRDARKPGRGTPHVIEADELTLVGGIGICLVDTGGHAGILDPTRCPCSMC